MQAGSSPSGSPSESACAPFVTIPGTHPMRVRELSTRGYQFGSLGGLSRLTGRATVDRGMSQPGNARGHVFDYPTRTSHDRTPRFSTPQCDEELDASMASGPVTISRHKRTPYAGAIHEKQTTSWAPPGSTSRQTPMARSAPPGRSSTGSVVPTALVLPKTSRMVIPGSWTFRAASGVTRTAWKPGGRVPSCPSPKRSSDAFET